MRKRNILIWAAALAVLSSTGCYKCLQVQVHVYTLAPTPLAGQVSVTVHK